MTTVEFFGVRFRDVDFPAALEAIERLHAAGGGVVVTPNVDYLQRARRSPSFRDLLNAADLVLPDGRWVARGARLAGIPLHHGIVGRRLLPALAEIASREERSLFLLGGQPGAAEAAAGQLARRYPGLEVRWFYPRHGFSLGDATDRAAIGTVRDANPDYLVVGLGSPRQEEWVGHHRKDLPERTVALELGAAIDVEAGVRGAPPDWVSRFGIEWAYRLMHEPRRLARRYLVDDPPFLAACLRLRLQRRGAA